jgi:hypothetical protein
MSSVFQEILDSPLSSEEQKSAARKMIAATKASTVNTVVDMADGRVTLSETKPQVREDGSAYSYGAVVVSESYAKELQKRFGNLTDGQATQFAACSRLSAVLLVSGGLMSRDTAASKFPDFESNSNNGVEE